MLLLADSGSTKTDWCYIDKQGNQARLQTIGMNPYNCSCEIFHNEIKNNILTNLPNLKVEQMYFYGSGCSTNEKQKEIYDIFHSYLPDTAIHIDHDLLGAAISVCGNEKGIAAILGTGSNSCVYDGEKITHNIPALGYILCDEGGGTNIGKIVLRNYLRKQFPKHLENDFFKKYPFSEVEFLNKLHKGPVPNRYLAGFAEFAIQRQAEKYCYSMIEEAFDSFFKMQITLYPDYDKLPLNVVGSVGYYAENVLKNTAEKYNVKIGKVIKTPMEGLIEYHLLHH